MSTAKRVDKRSNFGADDIETINENIEEITRSNSTILCSFPNFGKPNFCLLQIYGKLKLLGRNENWWISWRRADSTAHFRLQISDFRTTMPRSSSNFPFFWKLMPKTMYPPDMKWIEHVTAWNLSVNFCKKNASDSSILHSSDTPILQCFAALLRPLCSICLCSSAITEAFAFSDLIFFAFR